MLAARQAVSPAVARICLQVHDEILWKRSGRFTAATLAKLRKVCETGTGYVLDVPLKFEVNLAESWADKA
jgi:DNA polymerase I-like protein with 3'-5' exonuclease and polymerase domains